MIRIRRMDGDRLVPVVVNTIRVTRGADREQMTGKLTVSADRDVNVYRPIGVYAAQQQATRS